MIGLQVLMASWVPVVILEHSSVDCWRNQAYQRDSKAPTEVAEQLCGNFGARPCGVSRIRYCQRVLAHDRGRRCWVRGEPIIQDSDAVTR
jgi:hypothetical protein